MTVRSEQLIWWYDDHNWYPWTSFSKRLHSLGLFFCVFAYLCISHWIQGSVIFDILESHAFQNIALCICVFARCAQDVRKMFARCVQHVCKMCDFFLQETFPNSPWWTIELLTELTTSYPCGTVWWVNTSLVYCCTIFFWDLGREIHNIT